MDGFLDASQPLPASGRLSSDLSSTHSRAGDRVEEKDDAGRRSYEYVKLKPGGRFNERKSLYDDPAETLPWRCGEKYQYGSVAAADSWQKCHHLVKRYDDDMCDAWREEVDKLLIFAGLFSATVTAFTIESYQWLQEDSVDAASQYLAYLASEYAKSRNTTLPASLTQSLSASTTSVSGAAVRINTFWFLSLTLSLTTVLVGILCLQWLREFQRDASLPHKDALALRQMRFRGLLSWHVPTILSALPLLLQLSLLLFFTGLLNLLWDRNHVVASVISAAVGLVVCFLVATTALPALQFAFMADEHLRGAQCPYKSPQSWLFMRMTQWAFRVMQVICTSWTSESFDWPSFHRLLKSATDLNWPAFDMRWRRYRDALTITWGTPKNSKDAEDIIDVMNWVNDTFTQSPDAVYPIYHCLADLDIPAASCLISRLYKDTPFEDTTFRVMMDDRFSTDTIQKREIISTFYLHIHQDQHRAIKPLYVESVVRILNTQEVPAPFLDWLSTALQEISSHLISSPQQTGKPLIGIADPQILTQMVGCTGSFAAKNSRRNIDVVNTWIMLDNLLWGVRGKAPDELQRHTITIDAINGQYIKLACELFRDLISWVTKNTRELELKSRVEVCMEGLMLIFPEHLTAEDLGSLERQYPEFGVAVELMRVLEGLAPQIGAGPYATQVRPYLYGDGIRDGGGGGTKGWRSLVEKFSTLGLSSGAS
ncbi:hypothetical protein P691DRAFT_806955 [Macrolepiota fuliginosa MF-IS2]|uniref:DUF6535 domain-containing protein n=1 Tax=Macrolepiota fuliginosa MF-IS2 TaxID=1400762 RepID=A0A9P5X6R7_9AGAR|nr:hypothetical protein P691DRAFT_806955 [Macrolepiota fuliginosa MF-IS2]